MALVPFVRWGEGRAKNYSLSADLSICMKPKNENNNSVQGEMVGPCHYLVLGLKSCVCVCQFELCQKLIKEDEIYEATPRFLSKIYFAMVLGICSKQLGSLFIFSELRLIISILKNDQKYSFSS